MYSSSALYQYRPSSFIIKQARDEKIRSVFLGGDGWGQKMWDYVGNVIEGSYFSDHWSPEVPFTTTKRVLKKYADTYGEKLRGDLALTYDAITLLFDAINRAGSTDGEKIKEALLKTKDFQGTTGTITMGSDGTPENKDGVIRKFHAGAIMFVKMVKP